MTAPFAETQKHQTYALPQELLGHNHDTRRVGGGHEEPYVWERDTPSIELLPVDIQETVDPLICADVAKFQEEFPEADRYKLIQVRDISMINRTFEQFGALKSEERAVVMASFFKHIEELSMDWASFEPILVAETRIDSLRGLIFHQFNLGKLLTTQTLFNQLSDHHSKNPDTEDGKFANDLLLMTKIRLGKITNKIASAIMFSSTFEIDRSKYLDPLVVESMNIQSPPIPGSIVREGIETVFADKLLTTEEHALVGSVVDCREIPIDFDDMAAQSRYLYLMSGSSEVEKIEEDGVIHRFLEFSEGMLRFLCVDPEKGLKRLEVIGSAINAADTGDFMFDVIQFMDLPKGPNHVVDMLIDLIEVLPPQDSSRLLKSIRKGTHSANRYVSSLLANFGRPDKSAPNSWEQTDKQWLTSKGVYDSISRRLVELIAAAHTIVCDEPAEGVLFTGHRPTGLLDEHDAEIFEPIKQNVHITKLDQVIAVANVVDAALNGGHRVLSRPERVVLNSEQSTPNRATFQSSTSSIYQDYDKLKGPWDETETRIKFRSNQDEVGEARIDLSHRISITEAKAILPLIQELLGEDFDAKLFLKDNRRGKDMRTISLRLDLENFGDFALSFDMGSTINAAKEPLGFLIASTVSAGAAEVARLEEDEPESLPNNHVRSEFPVGIANPEIFGRFLTGLMGRLTDRDKQREEWISSNHPNPIDYKKLIDKYQQSDQR